MSSLRRSTRTVIPLVPYSFEQDPPPTKRPKIEKFSNFSGNQNRLKEVQIPAKIEQKPDLIDEKNMEIANKQPGKLVVKEEPSQPTKNGIPLTTYSNRSLDAMLTENQVGEILQKDLENLTRKGSNMTVKELLAKNFKNYRSRPSITSEKATLIVKRQLTENENVPVLEPPKNEISGFQTIQSALESLVQGSEDPEKPQNPENLVSNDVQSPSNPQFQEDPFANQLLAGFAGFSKQEEGPLCHLAYPGNHLPFPVIWKVPIPPKIQDFEMFITIDHTIYNPIINIMKAGNFLVPLNLKIPFLFNEKLLEISLLDLLEANGVNLGNAQHFRMLQGLLQKAGVHLRGDYAERLHQMQMVMDGGQVVHEKLFQPIQITLEKLPLVCTKPEIYIAALGKRIHGALLVDNSGEQEQLAYQTFLTTIYSEPLPLEYRRQILTLHDTEIPVDRIAERFGCSERSVKETIGTRILIEKHLIDQHLLDEPTIPSNYSTPPPSPSATSSPTIGQVMRPRSKIRRTHYVDLNKMVWKHFQNCQSTGIQINGKNLKDQAMRFAREMGLDSFRGSEGWLDAFKRRHRIDLKTMTGYPVCYESDMFDEVDRECRDDISPTNPQNHLFLGGTQTSTGADDFAASFFSSLAGFPSQIAPEPVVATSSNHLQNMINSMMSSPPEPSTSKPDPELSEGGTILNVMRSCQIKVADKEVSHALDTIRAYILAHDPAAMTLLLPLMERLSATTSSVAAANGMNEMCDPTPHIMYHDSSNWSENITSSSSSLKECTICGAPSNGYHFNAPSCSACAAFFRRTVTLNRNFLCSHQNNCRVNYAMRVICRCCRYQKCIRMGMERAAVQPRRDCNAGRRKIMYHPNQPSPTTETKPSLPYSQPTVFQNTVPKDELMQYDYPPTSATSSPEVHYAQSYSSSISEDVPSPKVSISTNSVFSLNFEAEQVLEDLLREERLFNERRKLLYCSNSCISNLLTSENLNDIPYSPSDLQPLTFSGIQKHIRPQILVIYEWLRGWRHFDLLNNKDRLIFLRRCVLYHTILDPSYLSYRLGLPDKFVMFNGMYVGVQPGDKTGWEDEKDCISSDLKIKLYRPLMERLINEVCVSMNAISLSFVEFVLLKALVSFKSSSCCDVSLPLKKFMQGHMDTILKALNVHYQSLGMTKEEIAHRTGNVILMMSSIFAVGMECLESHQKIQFFDLWQLDDLLIKLIQRGGGATNF